MPKFPPAIAVLAATLAAAVPVAAAAPARPVLLVFAHPDDEISVAPLASALARRGIPVALALATSGDQGAPADGSITSGPELARVREDEARCSATALGIAAPVFFGLGDGTLGGQTRPAGARLAELAATLRTLIAELEPRAIVTWGPDGGYGHPDHRLVSAVVTEVVLGNRAAPPLLYAALPADAVRARPPRAIAWAGVDRALLTVRVPHDAADAAATKAAALCHKSQYPAPGAVDFGVGELLGLMGGAVHLRPAAPAGARDPFE